ncbi:Phosphoglycolate phosphatase [invertebrate metagenome]|uniref:phosphoglycolate phosphatase n=1 Tax=invertebrate metagenome TaxID=1711999 RepID=A0A484H711_9ZZZZ
MSYASTPHTIIFDLDGTLIDSANDVTHAVNLMLSEQSLPTLPVERVRPMIGEGVHVLIEKVMFATGVTSASETLLAHCAARYQHFYARYPAAHTVVYDGVPEVLAALQAEGCQLGLCTNKPQTITQLVLEALDMTHYFTAVVGGGSTPFRKPDARPLWTVLDQIGVARAACVYVGDSEVDVATARNAGMPLVLVSYGYARIPVGELAADARINSFRDLPAVLAGFTGQVSKF